MLVGDPVTEITKYIAFTYLIICIPFSVTVAKPGEAVTFVPLTVIVPSSTLALDTVQLYTPSVLCLIVTVTSVSVGGSPSKMSRDTLMFSMGSSLTLQLTVVAGALDTLKERVNCGGSASRREVRENWTGELTTGPAKKR